MLVWPFGTTSQTKSSVFFNIVQTLSVMLYTCTAFQRVFEHLKLFIEGLPYESPQVRDDIPDQIVCFFNIVQTPSVMLYTCTALQRAFEQC